MRYLFIRRYSRDKILKEIQCRKFYNALLNRELADKINVATGGEITYIDPPCRPLPQWCLCVGFVLKVETSESCWAPGWGLGSSWGCRWKDTETQRHASAPQHTAQEDTGSLLAINFCARICTVCAVTRMNWMKWMWWEPLLKPPLSV